MEFARRMHTLLNGQESRAHAIMRKRASEVLLAILGFAGAYVAILRYDVR